jgi:hypothetical protein
VQGHVACIAGALVSLHDRALLALFSLALYSAFRPDFGSPIIAVTGLALGISF